MWRISYHFFYFVVGYALKRFFDIEKASAWVHQNRGLTYIGGNRLRSGICYSYICDRL